MLPEMVAAGIEAKKAAERDCLEEGDIVAEVYLAMYGVALRAIMEQPETIQ